MKELGQLEAKHEEFAKRKVRVVAISDDDEPTARKTQEYFPHIMIVTDPYQRVAKAVEVIHPGVKPGGGDTNAPTTFFVDGEGYVRRFFRAESYLERMSSAEVLTAIDEIWRP